MPIIEVKKTKAKAGEYQVNGKTDTAAFDEFHNLDQIRLKFLRKLGRANRRRENPLNSLHARPHPAVRELLRRL